MSFEHWVWWAQETRGDQVQVREKNKEMFIDLEREPSMDEFSAILAQGLHLPSVSKFVEGDLVRRMWKQQQYLARSSGVIVQ